MESANDPVPNDPLLFVT